MEELIGSESQFVLQEFRSHHDWLQLPINKWYNHSIFHTNRSCVQIVKVVNDATERGIKVNVDYVTVFSAHDQQTLSKIQMVKPHRLQ